MKSLSIIAVFFLVTLAKSVPTKSNGDVVAEVLSIKLIERTAKDGTLPDPDTFKFTFNTVPQTTEVTKWLLLESVDGVTEDPVYADETVSSTDTVTFTTSFQSYFGKEANFLINGLNADDVPVAYAEVNLEFPMFPNVADSWTLIDPREPTDNRLFRVQGSLGDMSLDSFKNLVTRDPSYFEYTNPSLDTDYNPCTKKGVEPVVCDVQLPHPEATCDTASQIMSSVVLSYMPGNQATIKFDASNPPQDILDIILMTSTTTTPSPENVLCTKNELNACTIDWTGPSTDKLQMILIQATNTAGDNCVTNYIEIPDRELVITTLGNDIIEGRWNILQGEEVDAKYTLTSTESVGQTIIAVDVDCSHLTSTDKCFGYFPNLLLGTYTLTVALQSDGQLHQIESLPEELVNPPPELRILSRHTIEHQHLQKANVKTCFWHPAPTGERLFSHYEMLIINGKGQWLKHITMEEVEEERESEGSLCFTSFTLNTRDFDLTEGTKVVVSQRGADGFTVLATGESTLF